MKNKVFLPLMLFVITALILAACGEGETILIKKNQCTITFTVFGASAAYSAPDPIIVARGKTMGGQYPADPVFATDNMVFDGWIDSGIRYDEDTEINADLDLTARWVLKTDPNMQMVTVTFNANGGAEAPSIRVPKNKPIGLRLPVTRKKGHTFDGWYNSTTLYTAASPNVTADIELTAAFTEKPKHTVSFTTVDKNYNANPTGEQCVINSIQVYEGEGLEAELPGLPGAQIVTHTASNVKFVMWVGDEEELYDEWTPINEDMTFHAKWGKDFLRVDLSKVELVDGDGYNSTSGSWTHPIDPSPPNPLRSATPKYYPEGNDGKGSIKNSVVYDGAKNRWLIMYRIGLVHIDKVKENGQDVLKEDVSKSVLPQDFNMGYYSRYTVRARFYGNERAILGNPLYSSGYMNDANAIKNVGDEMPPQAGYGQISWCVTDDSNGNPGQDHTGVIAQQYNLGTTTINNTWKIGGDYQKEGDPKYAVRPPYLLVQTSDNWIGWIEITEIIFHNGEDEFVPPPTAGE